MSGRAHRSLDCSAVPLLDVRRQNARLQTEIRIALDRVCNSGAFIHGPACGELEAAIANFCGVDHAIGCASGSDALLLSLMVAGIGPGDEVLLPSFTFFATASAVWRLGATPVFVDIDADTFNIDAADAATKIGNATRAIIPVHVFGQPVEMDAIMDLANEHGLCVIEDAAQALGARYHDNRVGSIGNLGCFSFYPTKNLGGFGDGGMITTKDAELAQQLRVLRDHGQHPRYHHFTVGVNSRLDTVQAAVLNVKLPRLDEWAQTRRQNARRYDEMFRDIASSRISIPTEQPNCHSVWNQYTIRVADGQRDRLRQFLADRGIGTAIYYPIPLHLQECFASLGYTQGSLVRTEQVCNEVISLPIFPELASREQDLVVESIAEFFDRQEHRVTAGQAVSADEAPVRLAS